MRLTIDLALCEGNAICARLLPEIFRVDGDEAHLLDETPPDALRDLVATAVRSCPRGAIDVAH